MYVRFPRRLFDFLVRNGARIVAIGDVIGDAAVKENRLLTDDA